MKNKLKPIIVQIRDNGVVRGYLAKFGYARDWRTYGKYRDVKTAESVIKQQMRKHTSKEMRIKL